MVCKKCGIMISKDIKECPNCGVRQNKTIKEQINELDKELENLKMGEAPSTLSNGKVHPNIKQVPKIDINGIINAFEELKVKNTPKRKKQEPDNPIHEEVDTKELESVIEKIQENKDLFVESNNDTSTDNTDAIVNKEIAYNTQPLKIYNPKTKESKQKYHYNIKIHNNKRNFVIGLCIFAFIFIIGVFMLYSLVLSPKAKFMNALEIQYTNIINKINNLTNDFSDVINSNEIQLNTTAKVTNTENGKTDNYIISSKYLESEKEQKQYFEYNNLNKTKTELKKLYIQNNTLYINRENSNNQYYTVNSKYISLKNFLQTDNIDYIVKIISKHINKVLNNNNFDAKKTKITIDNQDYRVREISLELDEKLYNKIYIRILKELQTDKTALHILSDHTKYSMEEVKKLIDNKIHFIKDKNSEKIKLTCKIYLDEDNKLIKQIFEQEKNVIEYLNVDNKQEVKLINNDVVTLQFSSQTKDNKTIFNINGEYNIKGEYIKEKASNIINIQATTPNNNNLIINSTFMKNKEEKETNRYDVFMTVQSNGFNGPTYVKNIEIVNTLETTSHFEIVDIPIQQNITTMPIDMQNKLKENFSMFIK